MLIRHQQQERNRMPQKTLRNRTRSPHHRRLLRDENTPQQEIGHQESLENSQPVRMPEMPSEIVQQGPVPEERMHRKDETPGRIAPRRHTEAPETPSQTYEGIQGPRSSKNVPERQSRTSSHRPPEGRPGAFSPDRGAPSPLRTPLPWFCGSS